MSGNGGGCGPRQTGTVPKTKHNTRHSRRELNQNLDWNHQPFSAFQLSMQRSRKESNTSRLSDNGDDYDENPWIGLPIQHTDDGARSWMGKSSNLSPERSGSMSSMEAALMSTPQSRHHHHDTPGPSTSHHSVLEEPLSASKEAEKIRLRRKIEQSRRRIGELQHQRAAYLTMRNKAIQQVKPVQVEEMHQNHSMSLRNKAIQQVKPVQQLDVDQIGNIERRMQNIQEFANLIQSVENDIDNVAEGGETRQLLRRKLQELIDKKAQMEYFLSYFESNKASMEGERSVSSEEGDRREQRERFKRDNNTTMDPFIADGFSLSADQWGNNMENPPQSLLLPCPSHRANGDGASSQLIDNSKILIPQPVSHQPYQEKAVHKKVGMDQLQRRCKASSRDTQTTQNGLSQSNVECWSLPTARKSTLNSGHVSSDDCEYDESPVKPCPPTTFTNAYQLPFNKSNFSNGVENSFSNGPCFAEKCTSTHMVNGNKRGEGSDGRTMESIMTERRRRHEQEQSSEIGLQLSQLQQQLEQMQASYHEHGLPKQRHPYPPDPWVEHPSHANNFPGYMSFPQWHQNQLLISSLNQCCQLIWHQLREITALRQALGAIRGDEAAGYGPNLGSLGWQPPLNNQVPPGNRANNYWDNFRSYSRQNLLSGRVKSNELRRSPDHPDNLRRVDNNNPSLNNRRGLMRNGDTSGESSLPNNRGQLNNAKPLLASCRDPISLEQSIYSELENVIQEPDRSPHFLLQLVNQLKNVRSHQNNIGFEEPSQSDQRRNGPLDSRMPNDSPHGSSLSEPSGQGTLLGTAAAVSRIAAAAQAGQAAIAAGLALPGTSGLSSDRSMNIRSEAHPLDTDVPHPSDLAFQQPSLNGSFAEDISRIIDEAIASGCEVVTENLLSRLLDASSVPTPQRAIVFLMARFLNARLADVADELLCSLTLFDNSNHVEETSEEEGAVGGCLPTPSPHSVETELAEADQRSSCDNLQVLNDSENVVENETQDNNQTREDGPIAAFEN